MGFLSDKLFDGRPFRILAIVDCHTREALATVARTNFRAYQVAQELDRIALQRGKPRRIRVDNGPEFAGRMLDRWAYLNKVKLDVSRPGRPTDKAFIEAFNSRLRQECLNASWFLSMADARQRITEWRIDYNVERPHSAGRGSAGRRRARFSCRAPPATGASTGQWRRGCCRSG
jgi:putative transposase